jgi:hypothetical protein
MHAGALTEYRFFMIADEAKIIADAFYVCADDAEARQKAEALVDGCESVEVWEVGRFVADVPHRLAHAA